jgi:hypothetical protein
MIKYRTFDFDQNNQFQVPLMAGWYKGIGLAFEFTNLAAQSLSLANLGFLRLYRDGEKIWDFSLDRMFGFADRVLPGAQRFNSPVGAAGEILVYVPFHFEDEHIVRIGERHWLEFQHGDITTVSTTVSTTILPQSGLGIQRYFPRYYDYNIRSLSAETVPEEFVRRNLAFVTVVPTANITVLKLLKDGNTLYDLTDEQLDFQTNLESISKTFVAGTTPATSWILNLYKEKRLSEIWGKSYAFGCVSTDASITGMTVELDAADAAQEITARTLGSIVARKAAEMGDNIVKVTT